MKLGSKQQQTINNSPSLSLYMLYRYLKPALIALVLAITDSAPAEGAVPVTTEEALSVRHIMKIRMESETAILTYDQCDMTHGIPALRDKYCWIPMDLTRGEMRNFKQPRIVRETVVDMVKKALGDSACETLALIGVTGAYLAITPSEEPLGREHSLVWRGGAKEELINKLREHVEATNATLETLRELLRQDRALQNQPPPFIISLRMGAYTSICGFCAFLGGVSSGSDTYSAKMVMLGGGVLFGSGLVVGASALGARFFRLRSRLDAAINESRHLREEEVSTLYNQACIINQLMRRIRA